MATLYSQRRHLPITSSLAAISFLLLVDCFVLIHSVSSIPPSHLSSASMQKHSVHAGDGERKLFREAEVEEVAPSRRRQAANVLIGSSRPNCVSKCGKCTPCKPVLVTLPPPGFSVKVDYYPQVWKCKCGNKLFDPKHK